MEAMKKVLVFAPHPDDEVIGCGGQICAHVAQGDEVGVVFMTNGEAGDLDVSASELAALRKTEAETACKLLGVSRLHWLGLPDGGISYQTQTISQIAELLRTTQPDIVYGPHAQDAHTDHRAAYQLIAEAINRAASSAFPMANTSPWRVATWLSYEVWTPLTHPQFCVDITAHQQSKRAALGAYQSQLKNVAYDDAVLGLNTYRGAMSGTGKVAECYLVEKISTLP